VGGGDSAIEAALGLSSQPQNHVTISYRKPTFFRLKARNQVHLNAAVADGTIELRSRRTSTTSVPITCA
jgi:cation diffusion facilitator CzcD-associated flavoprotein CzcO